MYYRENAVLDLIRNLETSMIVMNTNTQIVINEERRSILQVFLEKFDDWSLKPHFLVLINYIIEVNLRWPVLLPNQHEFCIFTLGEFNFTYCLGCWVLEKVEEKIKLFCEQHGVRKRDQFSPFYEEN